MNSILALVDFSDITDQVVAHAADLAQAIGSKVYILHVAAPDPDFVGYEVGPQTVRDSMAEHFHKEHQDLHEIEEQMKVRGVDAEALLVQGPTVEKALQEAERLGVGMLVMGSHGHGALRKLLVGSVAEGILRKAPCPVLVVPSRA